jgi:transposase InsO family protein
MPWKSLSRQEQRYRLIHLMGMGRVSVTQLCRQQKISRKTAYKWRQRYQQARLGGLRDRPRRPKKVFGQPAAFWLQRIKQQRRRRPTWGARKLRQCLRREFGEAGLPSVAAISRWLKRWGLARGRRRRQPGPTVLRRPLRPARHCNAVWTVDFKGWYRLKDGTRVDPLTIRDLYSRYGLRVGLQRGQSLVKTRRQMVKRFTKYGLPRRIRCDNGSPFGGPGPTGLTRLSAWWVKLGIGVEFITPGRPQENGSHEQFHRVYQLDVATKPTRTLHGQQRKSDRWLKRYNEERSHEALAMERPAEHYQPSRRPLPGRLPPWTYQASWLKRWVRGNGEINWQGKRRFVGEAFVGDYVGLQPRRAGVWRVYFGPLLVGELHAAETGNIRTARYQRRK